MTKKTKKSCTKLIKPYDGKMGNEFENLDSIILSNNFGDTESSKSYSFCKPLEPLEPLKPIERQKTKDILIPNLNVDKIVKKSYNEELYDYIESRKFFSPDKNKD